MSDLEKEIKLLREKADLLEKLRKLDEQSAVNKSPEEGKKIEGNEEATARAKKCAEEINNILIKNRCFFNPIVIFSGQGGFSATVKIMPIVDEKIDDQILAKIHNNGHDPKNDN